MKRPTFKTVRFVLGIAVLVGLLQIAVMFGIGRWYIASQVSKPLILGSSFIPSYATYLGLDAPATMDALINEVGVKHFRLVSYWNEHEPAPGQYDFSELDWQFAKAEQANATITLSVGLRQPRWPECHMPEWAASEPASVWQPQLEAYMTQVIERYRDSPALRSYQLENEFFLKDFGTCTNFDKQRLQSEFDLIKRLDTTHPIIMTRVHNFYGWPTGQPKADEFAISIYRRVWNNNLYTGYFTYPVPAWYYSFIAGWQKIVTGRTMIIHELQAEAWPPYRQTILQTSLAEQNESFNAEMLSKQVDFAKHTGMRETYLWGGEYWYYRNVKLNDPSMWNAAKAEFK